MSATQTENLKPKTETSGGDHFIEAAGLRFKAEPHADGWTFTCVLCGTTFQFGKKATIFSVRFDLAVHECPSEVLQ